MADTITVQFAALDQASADCTSIAGNMQATLDELKAYLDQLVWVGGARDAYQADQLNWNRGAEEIRSVLMQISSALGQAEQHYLATETAITNSFGG